MKNPSDHDRDHPAAHPPVSRRDIVILGGAALLAAAIPAVLFGRDPSGLALDSDLFMQLLADPAAAAKLGEIWFAESRPGETPAVYEARLARRLRAHGWSPAALPELARRALAASTRADYLGDRMVAIEKWHLAETEADLCALAALIMRTRTPAA
ncbi:MAG: hypothetical protein Q8J92_10815 [Parvibaculum sp.]|uniref:hypothetical protein n=1 Tax=Parvibaculum sp. TaxID=2024848 RepID=UPI00274B66D5|nr:hypothetical protein [Parvibaculum sp.]MDP2124863.1 hypothetical protein [Parvibaculum sp.]MDZ4379919.1 hypothetical protein [Parvibaculum sp.]